MGATENVAAVALEAGKADLFPAREAARGVLLDLAWGRGFVFCGIEVGG